ncbi:MAG: glycoside hydrolase family 43 protein [Tepidisphaeraceae bacterium]
MTAQTTAPTTAPTTPQSLDDRTNGLTWLDTDGNPIHTHGGGVLFHDGVYYWYGEGRGPKWRNDGVTCYSSRDLVNWKNEGVAMKVVEDDPASPIARGGNIERPKVIYNARTKQFVMWFHLELKGSRYGSAMAAVATSDSPTGPFKFIRASRPNAGQWPIDLPEELRTPLDRDGVKAISDAKGYWPGLVEGSHVRRDFAGGQMSRDMTVFVDPDNQKAYLISSGEENYTLHFHELTDDYTGFTGKWMRVAPGGHNEAPAIVKHDSKYYLLTSGCTGWAPNAARAHVATSMWGPWKPMKNPCRGRTPDGIGPEKTFGGQSTHLLPMEGKPGSFIAMFDVWRPKDLPTSGYMWLPARIEGDQLVVEWRDKWSPELLK